ncbi:MAG: DUF2101 family protein [Candidatus Hydrothermarchaeales archaeon]
MAFLEELGESIIRLFQTIFYYFIGLLIRVIEVGRGITERLGNIDKEKIFPVFERRNIEFKDYVMLKVQTSTLAFLIFSVLFIFNFLGLKRFLILASISGSYSLYLTFSGVKKHFKRDFNAYRDFFLSYLGIAILLLFIWRVKPFVNFVFPYIHLVVVSVLGVYGISFLFKRKYGRDYTVGKVIEAGGLLRVKTNYDICASVKPGVHVFENEINAKEGDYIKLKVEKSFLNLRGSKVTALLGVLDE